MASGQNIYMCVLGEVLVFWERFK